MASNKNDYLEGLFTNCPFCQDHMYAHGLFNHIARKHKDAPESIKGQVRFNCQGKCSRCSKFVKTNGYSNGHICQCCFKPEDIKTEAK